MTRSEAYVNYGMDVLSINDRIDKIYDDIESRTCENCEHFYEPELTRNITKCRLGYVSMFCGRSIDDGEVDKDFGCNKFERIDHD